MKKGTLLVSISYFSTLFDSCSNFKILQAEGIVEIETEIETEIEKRTERDDVLTPTMVHLTSY
jgi:hypothetical protein